MKKVININFQGRVIPIEETAFELLKQYIESLRRYFAGEEGREEIINDIQDRIGELFNDCLKNGATCITDQDLEVIINNMGRPEDFEASEASFTEQAPASAAAAAGPQPGPKEEGPKTGFGYEPRGRLYRNSADKVLGGVCSGLANYLKIDPVVIRILFVIIAFGGFGAGFLVYFVLWVVLPTQGLEPNIRKRLFRNPDDRMIGGVCGGIAAYFNVEVWIPRLIFAAPFLVGVAVSIFRAAFWMFHDFPDWIFFNGFGGSLFVIYIILWAVLPEARTASEKLEMRGAKIDLESIKNTVQDELQSIKDRAVKIGGEFSEKAQEWGEELKSGSRRFAKEATPVARRTGTGVFHAIGILFKIFFFFIGGVIAFALLVSLIALLFGSIGAFSLSSLFLHGFWEYFFLWATIALFLGIPIIAIVHGIIRLIIGRRSQNSYLRYIFLTLWILGLVSAISLAGMFFHDKRKRMAVPDDVALVQPSQHKLIIKVKRGDYRVGDSWDWIHLDGFIDDDGDSIRVDNVRLNFTQSSDADYHLEILKSSRGATTAEAMNNAGHIGYHIAQDDSILYLPKGLTLGDNDYFLFQKIYVNVKVPVGKRIYLDESVNSLYGLSFGDFSDKDIWDDNHWDENDWNLETGVEYIMKKEGLVRADGKKNRVSSDDNQDDDNKDADDQNDHQPSTGNDNAQDSAAGASNHAYRYHQGDSKKEKPEQPEKPEKPEIREKPERTPDSAKPATPIHVAARQVFMGDQDNVTSTFYHLVCVM